MAGFDLRKYRDWQELKYRAVLELSPDDLLYARVEGRSATIGALSTGDVWGFSGTKTLLVVPDTLSVVSNSTDDTAAGIGAQTVELKGVDANYDLISEIVTMNGTTIVTTSQEFLHVNSLKVKGCGSNLTNAGNITITDTAATVAVTIAFVNRGRAHSSYFTVPAGYTCFPGDVELTLIRGAGAPASGEVDVILDLTMFEPVSNTVSSVCRYGVRNAGGPLTFEPGLSFQIPEKSTVWFRGVGVSGGNNATCCVGYVLIKGDFNHRTEI